MVARLWNRVQLLSWETGAPNQAQQPNFILRSHLLHIFCCISMNFDLDGYRYRLCSLEFYIVDYI